MFKKYQHLERFGSTEVDKIEFGECYIFPKIDGTNASVWLEDGKINAGSRNRHLTIENDNAGFLAWAQQQHSLLHYLNENPTHRLFGEWLVPHSIKTYKDSAWRRFYIFDVAIDKEETEILHEGDSSLKYIHYEEYRSGLERFGLDYIPPICKILNSNYDQLIGQLEKNIYLIEDGKGFGEGIVLKNYDFRNKYNRNVFAKIVTSEFKEKHAKAMGVSEIKGARMIEEEIADKFVTKALCEKVFSKIENESGWSSKMIPRLLNTVFYDLIKEDSWEFVKEFKNPSINFKTLQHFTFQKVKSQLPSVF